MLLYLEQSLKVLNTSEEVLKIFADLKESCKSLEKSEKAFAERETIILTKSKIPLKIVLNNSESHEGSKIPMFEKILKKYCNKLFSAFVPPLGKN